MSFARASLIAIFAVLCAGLGVRADIVHLNAGGKVEGTIVQEDAASVIVQTSRGIATISRDEIARIERTPADPKAEFARRSAALSRAGGTANAWFELGVWASKQKLEKEAQEAFKKAIEADPNHEQARERLGFVRYQGRWITREEFGRRKGLVEHEGRLVTPEEKEKLDQGYVFVEGEWIKKEVLEARKTAEEERKRREAEAQARAIEAQKRAAAAARPPGHAGTRKGLGEEKGEEDQGEQGGEGEGKVQPLSPLEPGTPSSEQLSRLLDGQKRQARLAEKQLGLRFEDVEEGPLLVHTTQPKDSEKFKIFLKNLGRIYMEETRIYDLPFEAPIWPGKCQIYFFKEKSEFDRFATEVDEAGDAVASGGYFIEGASTAGYSKFHIAMYNLDYGTLAHELSHAFTSRFQFSEKRVIPWANEGIAEYMRLYVSEHLELGLRDYRHRGLVREMLLRQDPRVDLRSMMAKESIAGTEGWAYAISFSVIDFMITVDKTRFVRFLKALKATDGSFGDRWKHADPEAQQRAIEEAFGVPLEKFETAWKEHVRNYK